jgi:hypothetical protein
MACGARSMRPTSRQSPVGVRPRQGGPHTQQVQAGMAAAYARALSQSGHHPRRGFVRKQKKGERRPPQDLVSANLTTMRLP